MGNDNLQARGGGCGSIGRLGPARRDPTLSDFLRKSEKRKANCQQILLSGTFDLTESTRDFDAYEKEDGTANRAFIAHNTIALRKALFDGPDPAEVISCVLNDQ
jgi:hypothetical protein